MPRADLAIGSTLLLQELQTSPVLTAASLHLLSCDSDAFDQRELIRYNSELTGSNVESPLLALARRPSDTASPNAAELFVAWRRLNLIWWYCACPSLRSWATDKQQANPLSGIDEAAVQAVHAHEFFEELNEAVFLRRAAAALAAVAGQATGSGLPDLVPRYQLNTLLTAFQLLDHDGDGVIGATDLQSHFVARGRLLSAKRVSRIIGIVAVHTKAFFVHEIEQAPAADVSASSPRAPLRRRSSDAASRKRSWLSDIFRHDSVRSNESSSSIEVVSDQVRQRVAERLSKVSVRGFDFPEFVAFLSWRHVEINQALAVEPWSVAVGAGPATPSQNAGSPEATASPEESVTTPVDSSESGSIELTEVSETDAAGDAKEKRGDGEEDVQLRVWCRFHLQSDVSAALDDLRERAEALPPLTFEQFKTLVETLAPRSHAPLHDQQRSHKLMWALLTGMPGMGGHGARLTLTRFVAFFDRSVVDPVAGLHARRSATLLREHLGEKEAIDGAAGETGLIGRISGALGSLL